MSVVLVNGLSPAAQARVNIPSSQITRDSICNDPSLKMKHKSLKSVDVMDTAVRRLNDSGGRGVLPCKPGWNMGNRVLRRAAISDRGGIYPQTGIARHQEPGLAYDAAKPLRLPLIPHASSFNAAILNPIPQPR